MSFHPAGKVKTKDEHHRVFDVNLANLPHPRYTKDRFGYYVEPFFLHFEMHPQGQFL